MAQWSIASEIFKSVSSTVSKLSNESCQVKVNVNDISQSMCDKSGQRLIIDEQQYEQPARFEMCLCIYVSSSDAAKALLQYAKIAVYFKDNPSIDISKFNWHGCNDGKVYLEPVIRHADPEKLSSEDGNCRLELRYIVEFSLNSEKASAFKRVEKRDIRSFVKE